MFHCGWVHIALWDGDRDLIIRTFHDLNYSDEWKPDLVNTEWKIRLPHVPACFVYNNDPTRIEVIYPWGETEIVASGFEYE